MDRPRPWSMTVADSEASARVSSVPCVSDQSETSDLASHTMGPWLFFAALKLARTKKQGRYRYLP
jgi:hypothetical protein